MAPRAHSSKPEAGRLSLRSEFRRTPCLGGVELLRAVVSHGCYGVHSHDEYTIALVDEGASEFLLDGRPCRAHAGCLLVIPARVPHTGGASDAPVRYRAVLVPAGVVAEACGVGARLRAGVIEDPELAARFGRLHDALMRAPDGRQPASGAGDAIRHDAPPITHTLDAELSAVLSLLPREPSAALDADRPRETRRIRMVREHLQANLNSSASLDELSDLVGVSPFYLQRTFKAAVRMSPREYLMDLRIRRARELLRQGMPSRRVSTEVGFFDQSHFTRAFRRLTGVTPGQFAAGDGRVGGATG